MAGAQDPLADHAGECIALYTSYGQRFAMHWNVLEDLLVSEGVIFTALDGANEANKRIKLWELSTSPGYDL